MKWTSVHGLEFVFNIYHIYRNSFKDVFGFHVKACSKCSFYIVCKSIHGTDVVIFNVETLSYIYHFLLLPSLDNVYR